MRTHRDLFLDELADIYHAEKQLTRALPVIASAASHEALREAVGTHLGETEDQVCMVEDIFRTLGHEPRTKKCEAMAGLLKEADKIIAENEGSPTLDAAIISALQKIEHYEIASYGCLAEWAGQFGKGDVVEFLEELLEQEKATDALLTNLAREQCNRFAVPPEDGVDAEGDEVPSRRSS